VLTPRHHTHTQTGVALSLDGKLLVVGAPTAWDNNMDCQSGAVYLIDVDKVCAGAWARVRRGGNPLP
jgi:hypothetical protein